MGLEGRRGLDHRQPRQALAERESGEPINEPAPLATGAIVGTWLKVDGKLANPVDAARVRRLADAVRGRFFTG